MAARPAFLALLCSLSLGLGLAWKLTDLFSSLGAATTRAEAPGDAHTQDLDHDLAPMSHAAPGDYWTDHTLVAPEEPFTGLDAVHRELGAVDVDWGAYCSYASFFESAEVSLQRFEATELFTIPTGACFVRRV